MKICEILSVGTELLLGDTTDTNATFLSRKLRELGFAVYHRQTVGDNEKRMSEAMALALSRSDLVLVTGGLGPTYDDITRSVAARLFEMPLVKNEAVAEDIRAYFHRRDIEMSDNNFLQAMVPQGGEILPNLWGTAPGLRLKKNGKEMILLPGVPREMKEIFAASVEPVLAEASGGKMKTEILHFYGISESLLDEKIGLFMKASKNPTMAPYAANGEVEVHITALGNSEDEIETICREAKEKILSLVGEYCYGEGNTSVENEVVNFFRQKKITLATAESCTGGLLSQRITSIPGASDVFSFGVTTYSEEKKMQVLGVSPKTLREEGVYSRACALEMARGVRELAGSDVGIGITGIAGPSGETETDPVGTVYIAVASKEKYLVERCVFGRGKGDRAYIRHQAATKAMIMALLFCKNDDK